MSDVYENCPVFENKKYLLRFVAVEDCLDLLRVYSDEAAVPLFNSDNCGGDDFYYTTPERMAQAIHYWHSEYAGKGFVRWSIVDKTAKAVVGTIELFHRDSQDYFSNAGILRLDLKSEYEKAEEIESILSMILPNTYSLFHCDKIATKVKPEAVERQKALKWLHFRYSGQKLIGHDGTAYDSYYILRQGE